MMMWRLIAVILLGLVPAAHAAVTTPFNVTVTIGAVTAFVPVHTFFMAPNGNDNNTGVDAAHPWASPNHAVSCGDVIVAAPGIYNGDMSTWGTVSSCPSPNDGVHGINGTGGIWAAVLLCGGSDLAPTGSSTSCNIDCHVAVCNGPAQSPIGIRAAMAISSNFWAVEGWVIQGDGTSDAQGSGMEGFMATGCGAGGSPPAAAPTHHVSLINSIIYNVGQGWAPTDCNQASDPKAGADYLGIVGLITQNSNFTNRFGICIGAVDLISPGVFGTATDTHVWMSDIINYNQISPDCSGAFDGENFLFDTLDNHAPVSNSTYVLANSIGYYSTRMCMSWQFHEQSFTSPFVKYYNNSCYKNVQTDSTGGSFDEGIQSDCFFNGAVCVLPWQIQIYNNIVFEPDATPPLGSNSISIYAWQTGGNSNNVKNGTQVRAGAQNIFWDVTTVQQFAVSPTTGPGPYPVIATNGTIGTQANNSGPLDLYQNPNFQNGTDLINNHLGVPNCTGFVNTTQCAGWNATTQTLTPLSIIADLSPSCAGLPNNGNTQWCGGKGYQPPSTTCVTTGDIATDFPPWLKGLVYLHWNGTSVEQRHDLSTTPCNF